MFDSVSLLEFYDAISREAGVDIGWFQSELNRLFRNPRSQTDIQLYREARKPWKKLADEVVPVSSYLQAVNIASGRVRFSLNDTTPDCWLLGFGARPQGLEITVARSRERIMLAKELNTKGYGRGFLGLPDDAPSADFEKALSRPRVMYTTEQALTAMEQGVIKCLKRKNGRKYEGFTLIIQTNLRSLPGERWELLMPRLSLASQETSFHEIYLVGDTGEAPCALRIK